MVRWVTHSIPWFLIGLWKWNSSSSKDLDDLTTGYFPKWFDACTHHQIEVLRYRNFNENKHSTHHECQILLTRKSKSDIQKRRFCACNHKHNGAYSQMPNVS